MKCYSDEFKYCLIVQRHCTPSDCVCVLPGQLNHTPTPFARMAAVPKPKKLYLIGSMRNPKVPKLGIELRKHGYDVFDDWHCSGPEADDFWQAYEKERGRSYKEALAGEHARNVFEFDQHHIDASDALVLVMPAGKSAHMELGYARGKGKKTYVLFEEEPERFDIMYRFATAVCFSVEELLEELKK